MYRDQKKQQHWSLQLTWREASEGSLDVQKHLVEVLVVVSIDRLWRMKTWFTSARLSESEFPRCPKWSVLPSCSGMLSTDTLRSLGHTCRRISSVRRPPSLMAMRLRAGTSTGVTFRACVISAIFLFRRDSPSANMKTGVSALSPTARSYCASADKFTGNEHVD